MKKTTMSVQTLIREFAPAWGEDWEEVVELMWNDSLDREILGRLFSDFVRDGGYRQPVVVRSGVIVDGTHRIVALYDLPASVIDVVQLDSDDWEEVESAWVHVILTHEDYDAAFEILRSVPVGERGWLSTASMGAVDGIFDILYELDGLGAVGEADIRAALVGVGASGVQIRIFETTAEMDAYLRTI